ncbi:MAG: hypothetical protein ACJ741_18480 [Pyrinomonadaceae bacterium]
MKRRAIFLTMLLLSLVSLCRAQQADTPEIYAESWKAGLKIRERVLNFKLDPSSGDQVDILRDVGNGEYRLRLRHSLAQAQFDIDYWVIELRQILPDGKDKKKHLGDNLLSWGGGGGDYFPKEDYIGMLYPKEAPTTPVETMLKGPFYPISAKRVIKIQNFYMIIQVNSYRLSESNPKKLESMDVTIEFANTYKNCGTQ